MRLMMCRALSISPYWPVKTDRAALTVAGDGYNMSMNFEQTKLFGLLPLPGGKVWQLLLATS